MKLELMQLVSTRTQTAMKKLSAVSLPSGGNGKLKYKLGKNFRIWEQTRNDFQKDMAKIQESYPRLLPPVDGEKVVTDEEKALVQADLKSLNTEIDEAAHVEVELPAGILLLTEDELGLLPSTVTIQDKVFELTIEDLSAIWWMIEDENPVQPVFENQPV